MRCTSEWIRLGVALGVSLLLHATLLLPASFPGPDGRAGPQARDLQDGRLSVRLQAEAASAMRTPNQAEAPQPGSPSQTDPGPSLDPDLYYSRRQLSRAPSPLEEVNLDIPESALLMRPGTVVLTLKVDSQGRVVAYQVESTNGEPEEYVTALAEAFAAVRFSPGEIAGHKVNSVLKVEITHDASGEAPR